MCKGVHGRAYILRAAVLGVTDAPAALVVAHICGVGVGHGIKAREAECTR